MMWLPDPEWRWLVGDCRSQLTAVADESVQTVVTSPPYFNLRDYGTGRWEGGVPECDHAGAKRKSRYDYSLTTSPIQDGSRTGTDAPKWLATCPTCGATRVDEQIGMEGTVDEYVDAMVAVFNELKRVLRDDGTVWLNLGDSYVASATGAVGASSTLEGGLDTQRECQKRASKIVDGLRPKNLIGIPWRVAFALQTHGWYLRSDIIWSKPNPMPESITDRPTRSHEYIFLLTKNARYFYDREAIREAPKPWNEGRMAAPKLGPHRPTQGARDQNVKQYPDVKGANRKSVWHISTQAFKEAHFATFPEELVEPCIAAGTPSGGSCGRCGRPYARVGVEWEPTCPCVGAARVPATVLDPFAGSGTVGLVALSMGRSFVGVDLNPAYGQLAERRIVGDAPLFNATNRI